MKLISILPEQLKSVAMTAQWENKLLSVDKGKAEFHLEFPKGKSKRE